MEVQSENEMVTDVKKGPWTEEEDAVLRSYVETHGEGRWNYVAYFAGLKRTGKSCRIKMVELPATPSGRNRETFAGEDRQRDKELLEDQSAKASQASEMRREQPAIPGHDALRVDAPVGRADPGCRIQGSTRVPPVSSSNDPIFDHRGARTAELESGWKDPSFMPRCRRGSRRTPPSKPKFLQFRDSPSATICRTARVAGPGAELGTRVGYTGSRDIMSSELLLDGGDSWDSL
ncbi:uncharacterized protein J3R85_010168 [Psidium guajava]|nr:uncharacterized protein J3R85_010168 [Psidium guajava]